MLHNLFWPDLGLFDIRFHWLLCTDSHTRFCRRGQQQHRSQMLEQQVGQELDNDNNKHFFIVIENLRNVHSHWYNKCIPGAPYPEEAALDPPWDEWWRNPKPSGCLLPLSGFQAVCFASGVPSTNVATVHKSCKWVNIKNSKWQYYLAPPHTPKRVKFSKSITTRHFMFDCLLKFAVKQSLVDWWWWREMLHHLYSKLELRRAIIDTVIQDLLDKIRLSYQKIGKI